ncbi:MAG: hypothetical protein ACYCUI_17315 [Vulcanimicrobiaceae bacterium]
MSYILTYMQAAATKPWPHTVFSFRLQGLEVCIKAFQMVYGFSKKKWTAAKEYYITSTSIPIHGNKGLVRPSAEQQHSCLWLSLFVESIGDRHPTNGSIHLPISLTKKDIHSLMIEQEADISHLSYSAFCEMWKTYFSHVKQPQGCHLGKCLECISLASSRLRAHSEEEVIAYQEKKKKHLTLIMSEREAYRKRIGLAKSQRSSYMSMIMDFSNPIQLPYKCPVPKSWIQYSNRLHVMVNGLINHGRGKHITLVVGPAWNKNSNLVISILFHHLKQSFNHHVDCVESNNNNNNNNSSSSSAVVASPRPSTLYLQADNCSGENKNIYVFAFLSFLIQLDVFTDIYYNFLPTGHTHEDIDQLFSVLQKKARSTNVPTVSSLLNFMKSAYRNEEAIPKVDTVSTVWDWKSWFSDHVNAIHGHSKPHSFHFFKNDGISVIQNKDYSSQGQWSTPWKLLASVPTGVPFTVPSASLPPSVREDFTTFVMHQHHALLTENELSEWNQFFSDFNLNATMQAVQDEMMFSCFTPHPLAIHACEIAVPQTQIHVNQRQARTNDSIINFTDLQYIAVRPCPEQTTDPFWLAQIQRNGVLKQSLRIKWLEQDPVSSCWVDGNPETIRKATVLHAGFSFCYTNGISSRDICIINNHL